MPAVRVESLSKQYALGERVRYFTLRDTLAKAATAILRRGPRAEHETIWALRDVSFEVEPGQVVGIIGRNGAGKSTLLKILSRITDPTEGRALIRGRVGSLLEVGTGFHLELTGRENIQLNGAILGMSRREIDSLFDEIVDFAGVARFIDTPVKRYSSGMYLRLAFSVAAHLQSEILLVDEVLAVGDLAFQRKCLGKMGDVAAGGKTVLFVSHNLGAIKELCQRALVFDAGALVFDGKVVEGLSAYSRSVIEADEHAGTDSHGWGPIRIDGAHAGASPLQSGSAPVIEARLDLPRSVLHSRFFCILNDSVGNLILHQRIDASSLGRDALSAGSYSVRLELPPLWLAPGVYTLHFKFIGSPAIGEDERHFSERAAVEVIGEAEGIGDAQLSPKASWSVEDAVRALGAEV